MLCRHGWQCLRTMRLFGTPIDNNSCGGSICLESRGPVTGDAAYLNVEEITGAPEAGCSLPLLRAVENALGASAMAASATLAVGLSRPGAWKPDQSVAFEEFGHLGRGRSLAGELFDPESLKDQAQRALMLIQRLGLEIWFAIGADNHRGHLTSAMIEIA